MTRYTLHVPVQYNDGRPIGADPLDLVEARILDIADGFTRTDSVGAWRSEDGTIYREPMRLYAVDVPTGAPADEALRTLAETIAGAFGQEAVYLTRQSIAAELVEAVPLTTHEVTRVGAS